MREMVTKDEVLTENEDDIDVVEVDVAPGEEAKAQEAAAKAKTPDDADDDQTADDDADADDDTEDARLAEQDEGPEERERRREENRIKRARKRERQKAGYEELLALRAEIAELRRGQSQLHDASRASSEAQLDARLADVRKDIATADAIMAQALKDGNGDDFIAAQTLRDQAKDQERELTAARKAMEARPQSADADAVRTLADRWKQANASWYGAPGYESQTAIANSVDAQVMRDGYDPKTPAYYQELSRRLNAMRDDDRERPARRKENTVDDPPRRKAPPLGASRDGAGANGRRQVHLSRERVEAIKAAGAWDDPKERAALIKAYEEYDREHSAAAR